MTRDEFERRITSAQGRLYRIARGYLRGEHDCLDAVSEAILKAWQKQATLRREQYFDTWLNRILIRECINILRRQKRVVLTADVPPPDRRPSENPELRDALDALPQCQRVAVILHYMEGYDVGEIARITRCTKGTVCSRLHYARLKLREWLKEEME